MGHEAIKLELIEWLTKLEDDQIINCLKIVKDSNIANEDSWNVLTDEQRAGIERGLNDVDAMRIIPHDEIMKKYGF